jgi:hypothetical protein
MAMLAAEAERRAMNVDIYVTLRRVTDEIGISK